MWHGLKVEVSIVSLELSVLGIVYSCCSYSAHAHSITDEHNHILGRLDDRFRCFLKIKKYTLITIYFYYNE